MEYDAAARSWPFCERQDKRLPALQRERKAIRRDTQCKCRQTGESCVARQWTLANGGRRAPPCP